MRIQQPPADADNLHPVDSAGIELADVDIMDGLFERLDAINAAEAGDA